MGLARRGDDFEFFRSLLEDKVQGLLSDEESRPDELAKTGDTQRLCSDSAGAPNDIRGNISQIVTGYRALPFVSLPRRRFAVLLDHELGECPVVARLAVIPSGGIYKDNVFVGK